MYPLKHPNIELYGRNPTCKAPQTWLPPVVGGGFFGIVRLSCERDGRGHGVRHGVRTCCGLLQDFLKSALFLTTLVSPSLEGEL